MRKLKCNSIILLVCILLLNFSLVLTTNSHNNNYIPIERDDMGLNAIHYSDWNQNITVGLDGSLLIVEEMTFWLVAGSYGQAYRKLNWRNFHDVNSWNIQAGSGAPIITYYQMVKYADYIEFTWDWSRHSVPSGTEYTFILTYNISSAMDLRGNRDRVYWNVIGGEFDYSIYNIDTRVIFPKEYDPSEIRSTTYYQGKDPGDDEGTAIIVNGQTHVLFHQGMVSPLEAYTIDTDSPPSGIIMPFSWRVYYNQNKVLAFAISFVPIFLFFLILFLALGLDPKVKNIPTLNETSIRKCSKCGLKELRVVAFCPQCGSQLKTVNEIAPPSALTPAEVGVLLDEKFDNIDFVAEFFYLAEQGYLKIIQVPDDTNEIYFQRTEKSDNLWSLSKFDNEILDFVKKHSKDTLRFQRVTLTDSKEKIPEIVVKTTSLSTIKKNISSLWSHKNDVYKKMTGGDTKYFNSNPERVKSNYLYLSIIIGFGVSILYYYASGLLHIGNLITGISGIVLASLFGFIISRKMPKLTRLGAMEKASWQSYLQFIRGQMVGLPDPYEQFNFSMDHFSFLLIDPKFDLPAHLRYIAQRVRANPPPSNFNYIVPYWYYYPMIMYSPSRNITHRTISGFDNIGRGFESITTGISNLAESLPVAISNFTEGISSAVSSMSQGFISSSSSGGSSGFGGGFSGGGGGGGGGGIR